MEKFQPLANNLGVLRNREGLRPEELARQLQLPLAMVEAWEAGREEPTLTQLQQLAERYSVALDTLVRAQLELPKAPLPEGEPIKLLVLDVDGTLTDGRLHYSERGDEIKAFNAKDGMAIKRLVRSGVEVAFLTAADTDTLLEKRAGKLLIDRMATGKGPKLEKLERWRTELSLDWKNIAYMGDDLNDLPPLKAVGLSACPADAIAPVRRAVHYVCRTPGGGGCVREFIATYLLRLEE